MEKVYCRECECCLTWDMKSMDGATKKIFECHILPPQARVDHDGVNHMAVWPVISIETDFCFEGVRKK